MTLESFMPIHQWNCGKKCMKSSFHRRYIFLILLKQEFSALFNSYWEMFQQAYYSNFVFYSHAQKSIKHLLKIYCIWGTVGFKRCVRHSSHSASKQSSRWLLEKGEATSERRGREDLGEFELTLSSEGQLRNENLACRVVDNPALKVLDYGHEMIWRIVISECQHIKRCQGPCKRPSVCWKRSWWNENSEGSGIILNIYFISS